MTLHRDQPAPEPPATTLDCLIVGGGIHGVHVAARLIGEAGIPADRLRILDPGARLLERWRSRTATTGMSHLRSPSVHHLDLDPMSLQRFAGKRTRRTAGLFTPPFERPALELFNAHCDHVEEAFGLAALHLRDRAVGCAVDETGMEVELGGGGVVRTDHLVLAMGIGERPRWPDWAPREDPGIHHVFDPGFDDWPVDRSSVVVVGGGISAGHVALRLLSEGHRVELVSRHPLRQHQFDSDPGWLGPKFNMKFHREPDFDRRRAMITEARHVGSVPPEMGRALRRAIARGRLAWREHRVTGLERTTAGLRLSLDQAEALEVDRVLLATGFESARPGGPMIDHLVRSESLPCAGCGYPIVDACLRWHPRILVTGPLAELELGPVSRNIAGARRAGDRIVEALSPPRRAAV